MGQYGSNETPKNRLSLAACCGLRYAVLYY